jgi:hypothetical protein
MWFNVTTPFLRTCILIVLVSTVVLTFVIDTIIDKVRDSDSSEQKIGSLCIELPISTNMLSKTRESAQTLLKTCATQDLLGNTTLQDLESIFQTEWKNLHIIRIITIECLHIEVFIDNVRTKIHYHLFRRHSQQWMGSNAIFACRQTGFPS